MDYLPDHKTRLQRYIAQHMYTPFKWGQFDCCTFARDAVAAQTGVVIDDTLPYHSEVGAAREIKRLAGGELDYLKATENVYCPAVPRQQATYGDLVLVTLPNAPKALGVHLGNQLITTGPDGLVTMPTSAADFVAFPIKNIRVR